MLQDAQPVNQQTPPLSNPMPMATQTAAPTPVVPPKKKSSLFSFNKRRVTITVLVGAFWILFLAGIGYAFMQRPVLDEPVVINPDVVTASRPVTSRPVSSPASAPVVDLFSNLATKHPSNFKATLPAGWNLIYLPKCNLNLPVPPISTTHNIVIGGATFTYKWKLEERPSSNGLYDSGYALSLVSTTVTTDRRVPTTAALVVVNCTENTSGLNTAQYFDKYKQDNEANTPGTKIEKQSVQKVSGYDVLPFSISVAGATTSANKNYVLARSTKLYSIHRTTSESGQSLTQDIDRIYNNIEYLD